jgi:hypothetical protein
MTGPGWLGWLFAVVMLGTAAYCAGRLAVAWRSRRPTGYAVDLTHVLMGSAMAGMLVPGLGFAPAGLWQVTFAATGCWFAAQAVRGLARGGRTEGQPGAAGHAVTGPFVHVLACGAMLVMLAAPASAAGSTAMADSETATGGLLPVLAILCAVGLLASVVLAADRLTVLAPVPAAAPARAGAGTAATAATAATVSPGTPMSLRLAACCDIAVGVAMGYLLILMIN